MSYGKITIKNIDKLTKEELESTIGGVWGEGMIRSWGEGFGITTYRGHLEIEPNNPNVAPHRPGLEAIKGNPIGDFLYNNAHEIALGAWIVAALGALTIVSVGVELIPVAFEKIRNRFKK